MGGLNNSATKDAGNSFGHNRFFDYQLEQEIINQTDDVLPYYFVSIPANVSSLKFDFGNIEQSLMTVLNRYVNLITDENIVMLGDSNAQTSSLISSLTPSKFKVAKGHNGIAGGMNNLLYYTPNDLAVNDLQKEVFDIVLGAIFDGGTKTLDVRTYNFGDELDAAQNYLNNPQAPGPDEDKY
jgi:hypothetical protein